MKKIFFLLLIFVTHFLFAQEDNFKSLYGGMNGFEEGKTYFVFGHNVKLRQGPTTNDEVVTLLAIGQQVEVLEETEDKFQISGYDSHWYKVKYGEKTGFVVGALLAIQELEIENQRFLFNRNPKGLVIRAIQQGDRYTELAVELRGSLSGVKPYGNRGLQGIKHILYLDYQGECCGCEMGGSYVFYDGKRLIHAIDAFASGDIDFTEEESILFPADKKELSATKIIFQSRNTDVRDEDTNWTIESISTRELEWRDGKFYPEDFRKRR